MGEHLTVLVGPAATTLGAQVCEILSLSATAYECRRFPDGEIQIELRESVRGRHLYLLQPTCPPVEQRMLELLLLADACRRSGAERLTAIIPYFGYARQDRRSHRRALGARVATSVIGTAGLDRLMLIDAHAPAIEGFFDAPMDHLTAVPLLARSARPSVRDDSVVVAPDLGAVKLAREYSRLLQIPMAFVHKTRMDGDTVKAHDVIGDVRGRAPLVIDDMLSTGGTVEAAVAALRGAGATGPITVAVTHALCVGRAAEILPTLGLARFMATDTVTPACGPTAQIEVTSVAPLIAAAIERDYRDESLADLRAPT